MYLYVSSSGTMFCLQRLIQSVPRHVIFCTSTLCKCFPGHSVHTKLKVFLRIRVTGVSDVRHKAVNVNYQPNHVGIVECKRNNVMDESHVKLSLLQQNWRSDSLTHSHSFVNKHPQPGSKIWCNGFEMFNDSILMSDMVSTHFWPPYLSWQVTDFIWNLMLKSIPWHLQTDFSMQCLTVAHKVFQYTIPADMKFPPHYNY